MEVPSAFPGILAAGLPWSGGASFKSQLLMMRRAMAMIVLCRDKGSGVVRCCCCC